MSHVTGRYLPNPSPARHRSTCKDDWESKQSASLARAIDIREEALDEGHGFSRAVKMSIVRVFRRYLNRVKNFGR
jgi:hypothetical protein